MTARSKREFRSISLAKNFRRQFLDDFSASFGIKKRVKRRSMAAFVYDTFGEKQCRTWLKIADGRYHEWERLVKISTKRSKIKGGGTPKHKAKARRSGKAKGKTATKQRAKVRRAAAMKQIARFTQPQNGKGIVNATLREIEPETELVALRKRLEKAENQGDRASDFKQESLKEQIALLKAETKSPRI